MELSGRIVACLHKPAPETIQVIVDLGIIDIAGLAQAYLVHDALTDPALELRRQLST
jgi:hypothetical protein